MKGAHMVTLDPPVERVQTGVVMWHFPMRDPQRFAAAIERRIPVLARERDRVNLSNHYRRWATQLKSAGENGQGIEAILPEILPDSARAAALEAAGILRRIARLPVQLGPAGAAIS